MSSEPPQPPEAEDDPDDIHGVEDATLGGYFKKHDRPPAFEGVDDQPYTVSIEVDRTADLRAPYHGYLVFPRWAETGLGIVSHVETPTLWKGTSREQVLEEAGETTLLRVKELLDEAIRRERADEANGSGRPKGT